VKAEHELPTRRLAERVLELVSVMPPLDSREDRLHRRSVEAAEPLQCVHHLGLLLLELALVRQHLPRRARVRRARLDPVGRRLDQLRYAGLAIAPLALEDARTYAVAGDRTLHEQDVAAGARDAAAAVG
jgi:hypothetical protein